MRTKWILTCLSTLAVLGLTFAPLAAARGLKVRDGVVHACLKTKGKKSQRGTIHVVNSPRQCKKVKGEQPLTWSLAGSTGAAAQGPAGPQGATGAQGPAGTAGGTGGQGEKGAAAEVEAPLKETIKDQSKEIQVLLGKVGSLTTELVGLESGLGTVKSSVSGLHQTVNESLGELKTELNGNLSSVKSNLEGTIGTVKSGLEGTVEGVQTNLAGVKTNVTGLLSTVNTLEPLTGKVTELTDTTNTLTTSLQKTCQQVGTVGKALETTGAALTTLGTHLSTVEVLGIPIVKTGEVPAPPAKLPELKCE